MSSCRVNGLSLGPIPFTAIVEYSKIFDVGDFEEFHYLMRIMDCQLLKVASKDKSAPKKK